jgi:hypothetical protein
MTVSILFIKLPGLQIQFLLRRSVRHLDGQIYVGCLFF